MSESVKQRKTARAREGRVTSAKMDKTIVVETSRVLQHPKFKKVVKQKIKYVAHDEKNQAKEGDKVRISELRPMSKRKRWKLEKVIES